MGNIRTFHLLLMYFCHPLLTDNLWHIYLPNHCYVLLQWSNANAWGWSLDHCINATSLVIGRCCSLGEGERHSCDRKCILKPLGSLSCLFMISPSALPCLPVLELHTWHNVRAHTIAWLHKCSHKHSHIWMHTHIHTHAHTLTHINAPIHVHTHTHQCTLSICRQTQRQLHSLTRNKCMFVHTPF